MATRTIVTSQPDVACDVCARRLLRGEHPDVFIGAGRRRIVCELCAPRAAHEGWLRESDTQSLALPPMRARRGRSLFERLPVPFRVRQVGRPPGETSGEGSPAAAAAEGSAEPYDLFGETPEPLVGGTRVSAGRTQPVAAVPVRPGEDRQAPAADPDVADAAPSAAEGDLPTAARSHAEGRGHEHAATEEPSEYVQEAIAVFNASEFPRRVAGVTRSLGAPTVTVRSAEHLASVVSIVVAWELCWYRYEVDLSEPVAEAQVIAQGTELAELDREDRRANASAAESGALVLASV
jgi:hypothetical protein